MACNAMRGTVIENNIYFSNLLILVEDHPVVLSLPAQFYRISSFSFLNTSLLIPLDPIYLTINFFSDVFSCRNE